MTNGTIAMSGITFSYPGAPPLFEDFSLALMPGERLALGGPNGSGKSTLLHLVTGLLRPQDGIIHAFGRNCSRESDFREVRRQAGYLLQDSDDQLFCPTVLEDVMFGPLNFGKSRGEARSKAHRILDDFGMADHGERVTYTLSGGEKRLVALAAVLAMEPLVLLLDEPTTGLDLRTEERLIAILQGLKQDMILVSHNQRFVDALSTRQINLGA